MATELHFQELISILRHRRRTIIAVTMIGTVLVLLGSMLIPTRYTATAQIIVETGTMYPGNAQGDAGQSEEEAIVQTHITALTSRAQLERVLDSLSHDRRYRAAGASAPGGMRQVAASLWHKYAAPLRDGVARLAASVTGKAAPGAPPTKTAALRVERFRRSLKVFQEGGSHVIAVAFTSVSPDRAALAANHLAELYVKSEDDWKLAQLNRVINWLDERIPDVKARYKEADTAVQNYRVAHGLADPARADVSDQKAADLTGELIAAESALAKRRAELDSDRGSRQGAGGGAVLGVADSPSEAALRQQENALLQSEAEAAVTLGKNHPKVQELDAELRAVRQKLGDEAGRTVSGLAGEVRVAEQQVAAIRVQLSELRAASSEAQKAEPRLNELEREATATGQVYQALLQRREQLRTQQEVLQPALRILSLAVPPDQPSSSSRLLFILPALIMFSIGGSLLAVAAERLHKGMRSAQDVYDALGIPCIGFVPLIRHRVGLRPHQYLLQNPFAAYTESIRSVVAALQLTSPATPPKVILISSSMPSEGKTTLAVSLAVYFALIGRHTLLIDLDFRHPAVARELGGEVNLAGLDAVLPDVQSWRGAVRRVPGLHLDYLPVPAIPGDPLVPFVGGNVPRLLDQLRDGYDCIIIDSPPLLAVAEARLLVAMADKMLLAVQWGRTHRVVAQDALDLARDQGHLGADASDRVGAVLTQVDLKKHAQYRYGGLESLRMSHAPPLRPPISDGQATTADIRDVLPFVGRDTLDPPPDNAVAEAPMPSAPPHRGDTAQGWRFGLLLCLSVGILMVPSDNLYPLVRPGWQKAAGLDRPPPSVSRASASQDKAATAGAGSMAAPEITGRQDTANREASPKVSKTAVMVAEARLAEDRLLSAPRAMAQIPTNAAPAARASVTSEVPPKAAAVASSAATDPVRPAAKPAAPIVVAAKPATAMAGSSLSRAEMAALVARGDAFVGLRDITSARLFYLRAAEAGDGRAAMRMAVTFDPAFLDRANVSGFGNPRQALSWYQRARDLGEAKATSQLQKSQAR